MIRKGDESCDHDSVERNRSVSEVTKRRKSHESNSIFQNFKNACCYLPKSVPVLAQWRGHTSHRFLLV